MNIYYVYAYLNQNTGNPYYIGKGQGDRINAPHGILNLPPDPKNRVILESNLSEQDAWNLEVELIEKYGRKDLGTGILLNRTAGGIGGDTSMYREYPPMTEETRQKLSESLNGKKPWNKGLKIGPQREYGPLSEETKEQLRQANLGKTIDPEVSKRIADKLRGRKRPEASEWLTGRPVSEETRKKISESNKGRIVSEEQRQHLREVNLGKTLSEETKQKLKGKIVVVDKEGNISKIDKDIFYSQPDIGDDRTYVFHNCAEGKRRKRLTTS